MSVGSISGPIPDYCIVGLTWVKAIDFTKKIQNLEPVLTSTKGGKYYKIQFFNVSPFLSIPQLVFHLLCGCYTHNCPCLYISLQKDNEVLRAKLQAKAHTHTNTPLHQIETQVGARQPQWKPRPRISRFPFLVPYQIMCIVKLAWVKAIDSTKEI